MLKLSNLITYDELKELANQAPPIARLKRDVIHNFNNDKAINTDHPIHYYVRTDIQDFATDAIYDLLKDKWIKEPKIVPDNYIEDKYPDLYKETDRIAKSLDISLGEVKRNILDYQYLKSQLDLVDNKDKVDKYIKEKVDIINNDLKSLLEEFNVIKEKRREVFSDESSKLKELWEDSPNWSPSNITFKLLEKWQYVTLLNQINDIYDSEEIQEEDKLQEVASLLKLSNMFIKLSNANDPPIYSKCLANSIIIYGVLGETTWTGSGFIISNEGHAITCAHVVNEALHPPISQNTQLTASFNGNETVPVEIIAVNYDIDVALIKVSVNAEISPMTLGSSNISAGEPIVSVSAPMGVHDIATTGIIASNVRPLREEMPQEINAPVFFIDVDISPGSSGGMVVSQNTGEVIGVARGSLIGVDDRDGSSNSLNYVISIDAVKNWLYSIDEVHFTENKVKLASNKVEVNSLVVPAPEVLNEWKDAESEQVRELYDAGAKAGKVIDIVKDKCLVDFDDIKILIDKKDLVVSGSAPEDNYKVTKKHIIVNRDKKTLDLYNGNKSIFSCKVSIGAPDTPSYGGKFNILEKEDMPFEAYYDQYLPFWMGFNKYWQEFGDHGCYQGIHAIPLDKDKKELPDKIGEENSHGCIRLSFKDAKKLYSMANVGDSIEVM